MAFDLPQATTHAQSTADATNPFFMKKKRWLCPISAAFSNATPHEGTNGYNYGQSII